MQVVAAVANSEYCDTFHDECRETVIQALQRGPAREQFTFVMEVSG